MKKLALAIIPVILAIAGYFVYNLLIVPRTARLAQLDKPPFYSVIYLYSLTATTPTAFSVGSEEIAAWDLGKMFDDDMQAIKRAGFGGVKLIFHFKANNYLQGRIALKAAQANLYPIGILTRGNVKPNDRAFDQYELEEWKAFVRDVVSSNKNIYFWEVWNEADVDISRYGTPEEFVSLLRITAPIIREEDPEAKIIVSLLDAYDNRSYDFSDKVLSLGGGDYFDILSFHPYAANPYLQEDVIEASIVRAKQMASKYNNRWPLWISEVGQPASEVGEEEQARLAKIAFQEAVNENIPIAWFYYSDGRIPKDSIIGDGSGWGLIRYNNTPRPAFEAITNFIEQHEK